MLESPNYISLEYCWPTFGLSLNLSSPFYQTTGDYEEVTSMENVTVSIKKLIGSIQETLNKAKELRSSSEESFFIDDFGILGKSIGHYADCFKQLGIKTKGEFDGIIGRYYAKRDIQTAVEDLNEMEDEWGKFLEDCDRLMNKCIKEDRNQLVNGDKLNLEDKLVDARSGRYGFFNCLYFLKILSKQ